MNKAGKEPKGPSLSSLEPSTRVPVPPLASRAKLGAGERWQALPHLSCQVLHTCKEKLLEEIRVKGQPRGASALA